MMLGAMLMIPQSILLYLVRQLYLDYGAAYTSLILPSLFAGVGSYWVEEGLAAYLGFELRATPDISDAGKYFNGPHYKGKQLTQQMIALAQFVGALITLLIIQKPQPLDLRIDGDDLPFFLAPCFQMAGLMCLMVAPKPPKRTLGYEEKEKF